MAAKTNKEILEEQFQALIDKAKEVYPDIDNAIITLSDITANTESLDDYLNLTMQTPSQTSNNHISY